MTDSSEWQGRVGNTWAQEWRRTDRSFGQLTETLLARTRDHPFDRALDVGCGAGELSLAIARARPDAYVTGIDISAALIAVARERAGNFGNVAFVEADAANWQNDPANRADLVLSRHGVMFFADPAAAFANLAVQAAPRARLLFSCFRGMRENAFASEIVRLLPEPPQPVDSDAPGPFAFADRNRVMAVLEAGGWRDVAVRAFDFSMVVGAGADPVADAVSYYERIGPAARAIAAMDMAGRERFLARVADLAARHLQGGIVSLPAAAWIVTAQKP